jgi:hypothetical protein
MSHWTSSRMKTWIGHRVTANGWNGIIAGQHRDAHGNPILEVRLDGDEPTVGLHLYPSSQCVIGRPSRAAWAVELRELATV